jgi:hypothetical protein
VVTGKMDVRGFEVQKYEAVEDNMINVEKNEINVLENDE